MIDWKTYLRNILSGAAAGFIQAETSPTPNLKDSGTFAGIGALSGLLTSLAAHPAVIAANSVVKPVA